MPDLRPLVAAQVPANVRRVCERLVEAGHEALTVGGAVRDAILGRPAGDWDVASSATPEQVQALFRRTIPTGIQHGTVTVIAGPGGVKDHVEVTTFRGEVGYSDGRHPDQVVFGVPLHEDLARRDLTINAIAYDPVHDRIVDPFAGVADLEARRLRAVGDPVARFTEDGLRTMRAVRFAAVLEFDVDPDTEAGIAAALPSLRKVSQERVCVELTKLLAARQPSRGLRIARRSGILEVIAPELATILADGAKAAVWSARVDRAPREVRLAAWAMDLADDKATDALLRRLKFSNEDRLAAATLVRHGQSVHTLAVDEPVIRRVLAAVGRELAARLVALWAAELDAMGVSEQARRDVVAIARRILERRDALAVNELAVTGGELIAALGKKPGPWVGETMRALLDAVLDEPARNERGWLEQRAREIVAALG